MDIIAIIVSAINSSISQLNQLLLIYVGFHTRSRLATNIMTSITFGSFINTGLLTMLTQADVTYLVGWLPLQSTYSDMDVNWYELVG